MPLEKITALVQQSLAIKARVARWRLGLSISGVLVGLLLGWWLGFLTGEDKPHASIVFFAMLGLFVAWFPTVLYTPEIANMIFSISIVKWRTAITPPGTYRSYPADGQGRRCAQYLAAFANALPFTLWLEHNFDTMVFFIPKNLMAMGASFKRRRWVITKMDQYHPCSMRASSAAKYYAHASGPSLTLSLCKRCPRGTLSNKPP
jgi:hypothetical protein